MPIRYISAETQRKLNRLELAVNPITVAIPVVLERNDIATIVPRSNRVGRNDCRPDRTTAML